MCHLRHISKVQTGAHLAPNYFVMKMHTFPAGQQWTGVIQRLGKARLYCSVVRLSVKRCSCFFPVGKWFFISSLLAWVCSYLNKSSAPSFCVWRKWSTWNAGHRDLWQVRGSLTAVETWGLGQQLLAGLWSASSVESLGCVAPQRAQCNSHFTPPGEVASFPREPVCVFVRVRTHIALFVSLSGSQRTVG